jgi:hypothetical protein
VYQQLFCVPCARGVSDGRLVRELSGEWVSVCIDYRVGVVCVGDGHTGCECSGGCNSWQSAVPCVGSFFSRVYACVHIYLCVCVCVDSICVPLLRTSFRKLRNCVP